jgi:hypothetical protein
MSNAFPHLIGRYENPKFGHEDETEHEDKRAPAWISLDARAYRLKGIASGFQVAVSRNEISSMPEGV